MAYSYLEIRNFQGLYLQQNSFEVPDGAMEIASRVVIKSDQVITKTNGLYEYWRPDGVSSLDDLRATYTFQGKLLGFFASGVGYFTDTFPFGGTFNAVGTLTGLPIERAVTFQSGMDFAEVSKNLYFTATQGVFKLEAYNGKVRKAGIPPGLGLVFDANRSTFDSSGIIPSNAKAAWRAVFGRRDSNGNLNLSSPTDVVTIGVPPKVIGAAYTVASNIMTVIYPQNAFLQNYGTPGFGPSIMVTNATDPAFNGLNTVIALDEGVSIGIDVIYLSAPPGTLNLEFGFDPYLSVQIPSEINQLSDEYFVQLYRSSYSTSYTAPPFPNFKLVTEVTLTQDDLDAGSVVIHDNTDFLLLGAELYTNPNTKEGELQENGRPPLAKYVSLFKNYCAYANISTVQRAILNLINPASLMGRDLIFKSGINEEIYRAVNAGVFSPGNVNPRSGAISVLSPMRISLGYTHTYPLGAKVLLEDVSNKGVTNGEYTIIAVTGSSITLDTTATSLGGINYQIVSDGVARLYNGYNAEGWTFNTTAEWTEFVARDLARAINANRSSFMYANYLSQEDQFPGKIGIQSKDFISPIYLRYSTPTVIPPFIQNIPDSFLTGIQFFTENDVLPNVVYMSKLAEPEAVPLINSFPVGSANSAIVGIFPLKDSLIVLKEDGVYRIVGDVIGQMVSVPIDLTIEFTSMMTQAASVINNTVIGFCNQGVVQITEQTVQLISRRIEDVIQPLVGRDLSTTFLFGHESDRLCYVQTSGLNPGEADVTWVYNVLNQTWTSTPDVFKQLSIGAKNELMGIRLGQDIAKNVLWRQRKTNTRVDYCGEYVIGNIVIDTLNLSKGTFTITGGNVAVPAIGDVVLSQNVFNRIIDVTPSGGDYVLTFAQQTAIATGVPVEVTLYKAYESIVKMAPFHAGKVGVSKHFAQMQIHIRQQVLSRLKIEFAGAFYGSSEVTQWKPLNTSTTGAQGWGFSPWGLFPWGLVDGSNIVAGTEPASIIRLYVPRFAARNTFIQPILTHQVAGEPLYVQALSWSVHGYGERVSS